MNSNQIITEIKRELDDPAILRTVLLDDLNDLIKEIAMFTRLPTLLKTDYVFSLTSEDKNHDMPDDYHHDLLSAYSTTNSRTIGIKTNSQRLYQDYDHVTTGELEEVAVEDVVMHLRPILSADEDLIISFYQKPDTEKDLTSSSPDCIPDELRRNCLIHGVCMRRLPLTDKGKERGADLDRYTNNFAMGFGMIKERFPLAPAQKVDLRRKIKDF